MLLACLHVSSVPGSQTGFGYREGQDALPVGGGVSFPQRHCVPACHLTGQAERSWWGHDLLERGPGVCAGLGSPTMLLTPPADGSKGPHLEALPSSLSGLWYVSP